MVSAAPAAGETRSEDADPREHAAGIELEVRPAGKRIESLSLLSGGEKSLTAIAFLFSLLLTKPSPFYVLDEVEAALDDANIDRFLELLRAYQDKAQFIVITHQRRTMEVADVLYGVTMAGDGESKSAVAADAERALAARGRARVGLTYREASHSHRSSGRSTVPRASGGRPPLRRPVARHPPPFQRCREARPPAPPAAWPARRPPPYPSVPQQRPAEQVDEQRQREPLVGLVAAHRQDAGAIRQHVPGVACLGAVRPDAPSAPGAGRPLRRRPARRRT